MRNARYSRRAAVGVALLHSMAAGRAAYTVAGGAPNARADTRASTQGGVQEERLELVTGTGVHVLDVEVAATPEKQALGLMYRTSLPDT